jgi:MipA family protein
MKMHKALLGCLLGTCRLFAGEELPNKLVGDIGIGMFTQKSYIKDVDGTTTLLPYTNFEYGRAFARVDTFGVKTTRLGYGYLEVAGRVSMDGFDKAGLDKRRNSLPVGLSTLQETPFGAVWINAFRDFGASKGGIFEVTYIAELNLNKLAIYPMIGARYLSGKYTRYYYGISDAEHAKTGYETYRPNGSWIPTVSCVAELPLIANWIAVVNLRREFLSKEIALSQVVGKKISDSMVVSVAYRF